MDKNSAAPAKPEAALLHSEAKALRTLTKRADFLLAARAKRAQADGFLLQARKRAPSDGLGIRVGFTCSKKVGNAVARNRAKRRLREIARLVLPELGQSGFDYVLVGRPGVTIDRPFPTLIADLERALRKIHGAKK